MRDALAVIGILAIAAAVRYAAREHGRLGDELAAAAGIAAAVVAFYFAL